METLEGFKTTLRLEAGHCFTSLMTLKENQLPGLMQSLEFTVWSPECYSAKPDYPCDLLVYVAEEMRIYHITTEHQLEELIKSRKDEAKICGIRPRENRPYRLEGLSFSDELPVELLDFSTSDLELAHYALNDLCQLILPFAAQESLKSQLDLTEAFKTHLGRVLPRIVRSLTDYYDPENLEPFEKEVLDTKALEQRKIFFGLFFDRFMQQSSQEKRTLFVELMYQRAATMEVYTNRSELTKTFQQIERTLRPMMSTIDIELYRNFIYSYHSINLD